MPRKNAVRAGGGRHMAPKPSAYRPPYTLTTAMLRLVAEIGEWIGRYPMTAEAQLPPKLRRGNRIRSIHASLAIEQNTLTLEQVTAVIEGKRVLGTPREIQEVRNAFAAYESLDRWNPASQKDLLEAHRRLMVGLVDRPGAFRTGGVGIFRGTRVVHVAPPASRVRSLVANLLQWLATTDEHPLVAGCAFHYEFEFIHPFADGNGRVGRLWQTLIASRWKPIFAYLPVETIVHDRQAEYYQVLARADQAGDATGFIEFMLEAMRTALMEAVGTDQVIDQVTDQVWNLLIRLQKDEATGAASHRRAAMGSTVAGLMAALDLSHRPTFRHNYLDPALALRLIERTQPDSPRSPTQRYRLTDLGRLVLGRRSRARRPGARKKTD